MIALQDSFDIRYVLSGSDDFFEVDVGFEVERFMRRR